VTGIWELSVGHDEDLTWWLQAVKKRQEAGTSLIGTSRQYGDKEYAVKLAPYEGKERTALFRSVP